MKRHAVLLLIALLLAAAPGWATTFYAVGDGNWSDTAHWSLSSGGTTGVGPPGAADTAIMDGNSGATTLDIDADVNEVDSGSGARANTTTFSLGAHTLTLETNLFFGAPAFADTVGLIPGTSTIIVKTGLHPHGQPCYDIHLVDAGHPIDFGNVATFHDITFDPNITLTTDSANSRLYHGSSMSCLGTSGAHITILGNGSGTTTWQLDNQPACTYTDVTDNHGSGAIPFNSANGTSGGNTDGWCFGDSIACPAVTWTPTVTPTDTPTVLTATPTPTATVPPACCQFADGSNFPPVPHPGTTCVDNVALAPAHNTIAGFGGCGVLNTIFSAGGVTADNPNANCAPTPGSGDSFCYTPAPTPTDTPAVTPTPTSAPCGTPPYAITPGQADTNVGGLYWAAGCCNTDTLTLPAATYTLSLGELVFAQTCTVNGAGAASTIIDANHASRVLHVVAAPVTLTVTDLSIINGNATDLVGAGGGLLSLDTGNSITLRRVTFDSNVATGNGGGFSLQNLASAVLDTVSVIGNTAGAGAGGGQVGVVTAGGTTIVNSTFRNNHAGGNPGGLDVSAQITAATISDSTFANNDAVGVGGGLEDSGGVSSTISNCTFTGNTSGDVGGGYTNQVGGSTAILTNLTISGNTATNGGAGIALRAGDSVTVANSIVQSCLAADGPSAITSLGHNIDTGTSCGFTATGDLQNTDPLLNTLGNNGGPTQTMSLQALSPAINGGDNAICAAVPVNDLDQRGYGRPGTGATACSIGAYENAGINPSPAPRHHGFSGGSVVNVR